VGADERWAWIRSIGKWLGGWLGARPSRSIDRSIDQLMARSKYPICRLIDQSSTQLITHLIEQKKHNQSTNQSINQPPTHSSTNQSINHPPNQPTGQSSYYPTTTNPHQVASTDRAGLVTDALEQAWDAELQRAEQAGRKPNLWRAIYASRRWATWFSGFLLLVEAAVMIAKPVVLRFFISWLQGKAPAGSTPSLQRAAQGGLEYGYGFAAGLALLDCLQLVLHHGSFYVTMHEGGRLKTAVTGLVYRKILRLGSQWQSKASTGQIVALVSNDAQRFEEFTTSACVLGGCMTLNDFGG
jgi:hypothetical protein